MGPFRYLLTTQLFANGLQKLVCDEPSLCTEVSLECPDDMSNERARSFVLSRERNAGIGYAMGNGLIVDVAFKS